MTGNNSLPQGWERIRLGDITEPSKEKVHPKDLSGVPYIGLEHIEKETGRLLGHGVSDDVRSTKAVFHPGDLLYGKLRPYLNKVYIPDFDGICSTDILVFPENDRIENKYLFYRFMSGDFVRYANRNVSGVQHPRVSPATLAEFEIELPPGPEQERIVAKIEETFTQLEAGVAELRNAKSQLKRYRASVLKSAVEGELTREWRESHQGEVEPAERLLACILEERRKKWENEGGKGKYKEPTAPDTADLLELPDGWVWVSVEQLASVQTGATPLRSNPKYWTDGTIPWVTSGQLNNLYVNTESELITELALKETNTKIFPKHTLLVAMYGEGKTRGKISELMIDAATNQAIAALIFGGVASEIRSYVKLFFLDYYYEIRRKASGGVQPNLNLGMIKGTIIPLPPLEEQQRIFDKVEWRLSVADEIEKELDESLVRAERLRGAVLKSAFEGRLV